MVTDVCPPNLTCLSVERSTVQPPLSVGFATWTFVMVIAWLPNAFDSCSRIEEPEMLAWTICRSVVFAENAWPEACGEVPHVATHPAVPMALLSVPTFSVPPCDGLPMSAVHAAIAAVAPRMVPAIAVREPIHSVMRDVFIGVPNF